MAWPKMATSMFFTYLSTCLKASSSLKDLFLKSLSHDQENMHCSKISLFIFVLIVTLPMSKNKVLLTHTERATCDT